MAIRRSMNVEHYKAQQAKPLFLSEPPRYVTKRDPFGVVLWALAAFLVAAIGFAAANFAMLVL
jgi:hypothetical protein